MGKGLVIPKSVDKELKKIRTFEEVKIAEFYNQSNDLITIFVIKSKDINYWKIGKNNNIINIFFCKDYKFIELINMFS